MMYMVTNVLAFGRQKVAIKLRLSKRRTDIKIKLERKYWVPC